jgi:uncharacterized membrane protein
MTQLTKSLKDWVDHGFISVEQAEKIQAHESAKPQRSWVLYGFIILGVVTIGIGLISLIASNWDQIPDMVKIICDFGLLIAVAYGVLRAHERSTQLAFEGLLVLFMLLVLATIGLVSQIYHTGGKLHQALLFWSAITVGSAIVSRRPFAPLLWCAGFFGALVVIGLERSFLEAIFHRSPHHVFMSLTFFSGLMALFVSKVKNGAHQTNALVKSAMILSFVGLFFTEVPFDHLDHNTSLATGLGAGLSLALAIGVWMSREFRKSQKSAVTGMIIVFLVSFFVPSKGIGPQLTHAILTSTFLVLSATLAGSFHDKKIFNLLLMAAGGRILVFYFQALGGLAYTGFGLIISGLVIIGSVVLWSKNRQKIAIWVEGLMQ